MKAPVDVPQTSVDIDVSTLQRRVQYRARRGILLSQGDDPIISKAIIYASADAPEISVKGTYLVTSIQFQKSNKIYRNYSSHFARKRLQTSY